MRMLAAIACASCAHVATAQSNEVLRPGALVILGEVHGTNEIPRFFGDLVETAVRRGLVVHAGLELPGPAGEIWTAPFQSGRTSEAMALLIQRLRGLGVDLFWFDSTAPDRDGAMAANICAARSRAPRDLYLVLVGNLHARKKPGAPWDPNIRWMSVRLAEQEPGLVTLDARYRGGSAWICQSDSPEACKSTALRGFDDAEAGVNLRPQPEGYDGTYFVGAITASAPAGSTAAGIAPGQLGR